MGNGTQNAQLERVRTAGEIQIAVHEEEQVQQQAVQQVQQEQQQQEQQQNAQYEGLERHFAPLPQNVQAPLGPHPEENMGYKDRRREQARVKKRWEDYKGLAKTPGLLDAAAVRALPLFGSRQGRDKWVNAKLPHSKLTMGETVDMVRRGDYSNFENLDGVVRNLIAGRALQKLRNEYDVMRTPVQTLCRQIQGTGPGVSALLDPALRLGLSLAQKTEGFSDEEKARFRELDEAMSTAVMVETLTHRASQEAVAGDIRQKNPRMTAEKVDAQAQKAVAANAAQQIQIAKRLLLLHIGNFHRVEEDPATKTRYSTRWDRPAAVAFSHCSRVALTLPKLRSRSKEDRKADERMWRSIFYQRDGSNPAEDNWRASSTHSIVRRKVEDGAGASKEKKVVFNFMGQRGMNVAIGGLGNAGISNKMLRNDGSCGHFYSMYQKGDLFHFGAMLMGLESDCAGVTNQMGHTHDVKATAEKASSLGGQRTDEVGMKYGGRTCDLSHLDPEDIAGCMETLEQAMKHWQGQPEGLQGREAKSVMERLAGVPVDLQSFMGDVYPIIEQAAQAYRIQRRRG